MFRQDILHPTLKGLSAVATKLAATECGEAIQASLVNELVIYKTRGVQGLQSEDTPLDGWASAPDVCSLSNRLWVAGPVILPARASGFGEA